MIGRGRIIWIIAAGALFQAGVLSYFLADYNARIPRLVPDDAYYYLTIAGNISNGEGSVFSPGAPTNGYHPLWMGVLVLLYSFLKVVCAPGPHLYLASVLLLCLLLSLANSCLLAVLSRKVWGTAFAASFSVIFFLFSPWAVLLSLNGLETGLNLFFLALYSLCFLTIRSNNGPRLYGSFAVLGIVNGLLMLTRTDNAFFCAGGLLLLLVRYRIRLKEVLLSAAVSFLVLLPWLSWSYLQFGSIVQSSARAMSVLQHGTAFLGRPSPAGRLCTALGISIGRKIPYFFYQYFVSPFTGSYLSSWKYRDCFPIIAGTYTALILAFVLPLCLSSSLRKRVTACALKMARFALKIDFLALPAFLLWLFYIFIRWSLQVWQSSYVLLIVSLAVPGLVSMMTGRCGNCRRMVLPAFIAVNLALSAIALRRGYYYPQRDWITHVADFDAKAGGRLRIGATDCGHDGFYSIQHEFVNVDGVVNNEVLDYIVRGRFSRYVEKEKFDLVRIADRENRLRYYDRNMGRD